MAGRNFFEDKKAEYVKCKYYLTSSIAKLVTVGENTSINRINSKLKSFDVWSAAEIDTRQEMLITLAQDVWKSAPVQ